ncbi:MAG: hypothetical protein GY765_15775, partial [bacterium]|nr:hypothetical protein [bacterium]
RVRAIIILLIGIILSMVYPNQLSSAIPASERAALIALYNSTNGDSWTDNGNWKSAPLDVDGFAMPGTENTWQSVTCDVGNTTVIELRPSSNGLNGTIPTELGDLTNLTDLRLNDNSLSGGIPTQLGNLSNLQILYLDSNQLSGSIPAQLGNLANLTWLFLYNNQLTGSIPMELANLSNLEYLWLQGNILAGDIPSSLSNLTALVDNQSDFRSNGLYATDGALRTFLDSKQLTGDWESTQTVAPTGVSGVRFSDTSVRVSWTPIAYTGDGGYYLVSYGTAPGGPYTPYSATANKSSTYMDVAGLTVNTNYYFVVATHSNSHGNNGNALDSADSVEGIGSTFPIAPTVTTTAVSAITSVTATGGGNVTNNGGAAVTSRGVCRSTSPNPTTADSTTTDGSGTGAFTSSITGLAPGTLYYVRAYAVNSEGTSYGANESFTTLTLPTVITSAASAITSVSASGGGNVTSDGGAAVTSRGVCRSTSANPTTADSTTSDGAGTGAFASALTGLTPGTLYYVRAYAVNSVGTSYGNETNITTLNTATVTTSAVSAVTSGSASCGGNVTADGGVTVTGRGVCWSTSPNPTTADGTTSDGTGTGAFTSSITGLNPGTLYYVRAYAVNSVGTSYGGELSFTTAAVTATVTTSAVSAITSGGASCGGTVTSDGGAAVTSRGVCWSTTANPTTADATTSDGSGTGAFTSSITGLNPGTLYYVRAYAVNSVGTSYGGELSFTTLTTATVTTSAVSAVTSNGASCGGNVTSDGGAAVSSRGVCWSTAANPTTADATTSDGTGTGAFTSSITGLNPGTLYYVRAYAVNSVGTSYGGELSFITLTTATVTTSAVSSVTSVSASCGGNVTSDGGAAVTSRGVCWSTAANPTTADSTTSDGSGTGAFTSSITGLNPGTLYYVRAYAVNSVGTAYGSESSLTTLSVTATVTTTAVSAITAGSAGCGGNVTSDGGAAVTSRGVCWSTAANPTTADSTTSDGSGTGAFTSAVTGLAPATLYYVRAYAVNSVGTSYGNELNFTTSAATATVITSVVSAITSTGATCGGNVTSDGGAAVTSRGVCWSTAGNPTTADNVTSDGTGTGAFSSAVTGLAPGTLYYIRAYTVNSAGTSYGNEMSFSTSSAAAAVTTSQVLSFTSSGASCGGNVTSDGGAAVTSRGVCWSTAGNPTTADNTTSDGTGTGTFSSTVTGLEPGTLYYVRAYAVNSVGTAYGGEESFSTSQAAAVVTTSPVTTVTAGGASCGGNVASDGGAAVTARGVCWGTSTNPTTADNTTSDGTGTGIFSSTVTGLEPGTLYYVRAYAVNSVDTAYGNELSLTTLTTASVTTVTFSDITSTGASCGGNVTADGGAAVTARGVCWGTSSNPTTADNTTSDGTGTGTFSSTVTDLESGTLYYVRAYAVNSVGTAYGDELSFTTSSAAAAVTTAAVSEITSHSAVCGGEVYANGGESVTVRGVCWRKTPGPTTAGKTTSNGSGTGAFSSPITGLDPGTRYYVRAYAVNSMGTAYGDELSFTTSASTAVVTTFAVSEITAGSAVCSGEVTDDGGSEVTDRGVCWSTSSEPTIDDAGAAAGTGTGSFSCSITGLSSGTRYYARAYAVNGAGTAYGNIEPFETPGSPSISGTVSDDGKGVADVVLTFSNDGGVTETDARGHYSHKVPTDWSGIVTPEKDGYSFDPPYRDYAVVDSGLGGEDYLVVAFKPVISGQVVNDGVQGLSGVRFTFSGTDGTVVTAVSDADGNYSQEVANEWSGTVSPRKNGYTFSDPELDYSDVAANIRKDYTASPNSASMVTVSGEVTDGEGGAVGSVILVFSNNADVFYTFTDAGGLYRQEVEPGWSGLISPVLSGFDFSPRSVSEVTGDIRQDFSGTARPVEITGRIYHADGTAVADVEVTGTGSADGETLNINSDTGYVTGTFTDFNGFYMLKLPHHWTGTVDIHNDDYQFQLVTRAHTDVRVDVGDRNFVAAPMTFFIGGRVAGDLGEAVGNTELVFSNGGGVARSDADGHFKRPVSPGWSGTVTLSNPAYTFELGTVSYENGVQTSLPDEVYSGSSTLPRVSGRITGAGDTPIAGVMIEFIADEGSGAATPYSYTYSGSDGFFCRVLEYGWSGRVVPSKHQHTFEPVELPCENLSADLADFNFIAAEVPVFVSGNISTEAGKAVAGVFITFSPGGGSAITGKRGNYIHPLPYGWRGTMKLSARGYTFAPAGNGYAYGIAEMITNLSGRDYRASEVLPVISGRIAVTRGDNIEALEGVVVSFVGTDGTIVTAESNRRGRYKRTVSKGWSGSIKPAKAGYVFSPEQQVLTDVVSDRPMHNFEAHRQGQFSIKENIGHNGILKKKLIRISRLHRLLCRRVLIERQAG